MIPVLIAASGRVIHYDRLFVFVFSPVLAIILLRLGWRAWKDITKSQR